MFLSPPEDLSEETLTGVNFGEMKRDTKLALPTLWSVLREAAYGVKQELRNKHKDPDMVSLLENKKKAANH